MDREAILRRFEAWLDEVESCEEPPEGVAAELLDTLASDGPLQNSESDLYSMQAAITALTQEVKLQSRSYKQLSDILAPIAELSPRIAELQREAETRARAETLGALLDMRDRLARGLASSRASAVALAKLSRKSWAGRFLRRGGGQLESANQSVAALEKGYELSLDRLDEILSRFHVSEISCLDREFDAELMTVVDTEETESVPEGTVLEVYRAGYEWNGKVYRTAQVKVARKSKLESTVPEANDE